MMLFWVSLCDLEGVVIELGAQVARGGIMGTLGDDIDKFKE